MVHRVLDMISTWAIVCMWLSVHMSLAGGQMLAILFSLLYTDLLSMSQLLPSEP